MTCFGNRHSASDGERPVAPDGYPHLLWHDEFDGGPLDTGKWSRIPNPNETRMAGDWIKYMSLRDDLVQVRDGSLLLIGVANDNLEADERPFLTGGRLDQGALCLYIRQG